jgi:hypothetical protein
VAISCFTVRTTDIDILVKATSSMLEFLITNRGEETIVVQSSGHQRFLSHWGPYQPDLGIENCPRITAAGVNSGSACLMLTDVDTGDVRYRYKPSICGLRVANADLRPKRRDLTVLEPNKTLKKQLDLSKITARLPDGVYRVEVEAHGAWWLQGSIIDIYGTDAPDENERVPRERYATRIPPLSLSCGDTVKIRVRDGKWGPPI